MEFVDYPAMGLMHFVLQLRMHDRDAIDGSDYEEFVCVEAGELGSR